MACHTPTIENFATLPEQKAFLRKRAKAFLKEYCSDAELMKECSKSCFDSVTNSILFKSAKKIICYMAMQDEINLLPVIQKAFEDGKKVAVPRMIPGTSEMDFYFIPSDYFEKEQMEGFSSDNKYNILEPSESWEKVQIKQFDDSDLFFIPGLAFNLEGQRLGRGKGFYDRYLKRLEDEGKNPVTCGVCFTICVTKGIPVDENDKSVKYLLNEYGLTECK